MEYGRRQKAVLWISNLKFDLSFQPFFSITKFQYLDELRTLDRNGYTSIR